MVATVNRTVRKKTARLRKPRGHTLRRYKPGTPEHDEMIRRAAALAIEMNMDALKELERH